MDVLEPDRDSLRPLKTSNLIVDNWTLQSVGSLLSRGLTGERASELQVSHEAFSYKDISEDALNIRCLFQILNHLVFSDSLFVDDQHVNTWQQFGQLRTLSDERIVVPKPFASIRQEWLPARQLFIEDLCVCPAMYALHEENVRAFKETGEQVDPYFGQLIWGGAGMLARAHVLATPYSAHPSRETWFGQVGSLFGQRTAECRFREFISEQRVKVFDRIDSGGYLANLDLPPVAAFAVRESANPDDLLRVALELREEYASLRGWLREFQQCLDSTETADILAREKVLQSVAREVDTLCSAFPVGDTSVQIGLSWIRTSIKAGDPVNSLKNRLGVRAQMNRLVLAPSGIGLVRKLAKIFGEENSRLGRNLESDLRFKADA